MKTSSYGSAVSWRGVAVILAVLALASMLFFSLVPTSAIAEIRYFEGNLSRAAANTGNKTMVVCDGAFDGNAAFTNFKRFGKSSEELYDRSGANDNDCGTRSGDRGIALHYTCEDKPFTRPCGRVSKHY